MELFIQESHLGTIFTILGKEMGPEECYLGRMRIAVSVNNPALLQAFGNNLMSFISSLFGLVSSYIEIHEVASLPFSIAAFSSEVASFVYSCPLSQGEAAAPLLFFQLI